MTHHWIRPHDDDAEPWLWDGAWVRGFQHYTAEQMRARGWEYSAPCVKPSTVAALVEALTYLRSFPLAHEAHKQASAALALYRGEAGR